METGGSLRGGAERRGQGRGYDLIREVERFSSLSPQSSDENQNRLPRGGEMPEEEEEEWEALEDSENNNREEESDNNSNKGRPEATTSPTGTGNTSETRSLQSTGSDPSSPSPVPPSGPGSPGPGPALLASLQVLGERSDDALLPQTLHQIAEAYFLEKDYEWAIQFLNLEKLYHERLLSNIAALQEQWEYQWKASGQQGANSTGRTHADTEAENLEALRLLCRTHQRSTLSVEKCVAGGSGFTNSLVSGQLDRGDKLDATLVSHSIDSITDSPRVTVEPAAMGDAAERDIPAHDHQRAAAAVLPDPSPSRARAPAQAPPTPAVIDGPRLMGGDREGLTAPEEEATASERAAPAEPDSFPGDPLMDSSSLQLGGERREGSIAAEAGQQMEEGGGRRGDGPGDEPSPWSTEAGDSGRRKPERDTRIDGEMEQTNMDQLEPGDRGEPEEEEEEEAELGEEEALELIDEEGLECDLEEELEEAAPNSHASLDDLAKRIQVEEITPAEGLVSILKRRASLEGGSSPEPATPKPKQPSKRKVRFREPDDGLDQDEVGGDSCLILLLLCLVTVVISVGGTALFCSLADAQSSVCTDFSHNVDFYIGHFQRGVEGLRYWLSPSS
ncbi:hypothetical protein AGOR_G00087450 [Albula goreensis]|uniref:Consortin C-terminal domain-containing protein n=1 Tax=Albula goreensis TaxID=1534307 RepID=A0A8T3DPS0_9TELE|nr:hypothetical protein AGOR_G00087450 [Albula goreensis]